MAEPDEEAFHVLLAGARSNDRAGWDGLYRQFAPGVLGYLRSQRASHPEDLLGEVWLNVVRDLDRFEGGPAQFRGWLLRIAHNRLVDAIRAEQRRPALAAQELLDVEDDSAGPHASLGEGAIEQLEHLLEGLPETQRSVVYLRFVLDLPQRDIAAVLGISTPAVKMLQMRATKAIGKRLRKNAA